MSDLKKTGIDLPRVTEQLLDEGIKKLLVLAHRSRCGLAPACSSERQRGEDAVSLKRWYASFAFATAHLPSRRSALRLPPLILSCNSSSTSVSIRLRKKLATDAVWWIGAFSATRRSSARRYAAATAS
jgi:hypothetical protein